MTACRWLLSIACAGCGTTPEPYEVLASANLAPGTLDITGPVELLETGEAMPPVFGNHMLVAFHVRLPDQTPRRVRLFSPASCDTPHTDVTMIWDLGEIRRVGDESHFFARGVGIGDRTVDVDVMTAVAFVHLYPENPAYYALNMMAVVQDLAPDDEPPASSGSQGSGPGDWLACGVFTLPK